MGINPIGCVLRMILCMADQVACTDLLMSYTTQPQHLCQLVQAIYNDEGAGFLQY